MKSALDHRKSAVNVNGGLSEKQIRGGWRRGCIASRSPAGLRLRGKRALLIAPEHAHAGGNGHNQRCPRHVGYQDHHRVAAAAGDYPVVLRPFSTAQQTGIPPPKKDAPFASHSGCRRSRSNFSACSFFSRRLSPQTLESLGAKCFHATKFPHRRSERRLFTSNPLAIEDWSPSRLALNPGAMRDPASDPLSLILPPPRTRVTEADSPLHQTPEPARNYRAPHHFDLPDIQSSGFFP